METALAAEVPGTRVPWAARIACAAASLLAGLLLLSSSHHNLSGFAIGVLWGVVALTAARPYDGLLVLAGLGPLITMFQAVVGDGASGVRFSEALTLAFLCGAAARRTVQARPFGIAPRIAWPAVILIAAALASGVIQGAILGTVQPGLTRGGVFPVVLVSDYLILDNAVKPPVLFAECLLLLLLTADICARDPGRRRSVVRMMVAGATGAAFLNISRLVVAAVQRPDTWAALVDFFSHLRVNVHYADLNAAGSYFAMMLVVAAAFLARRRWAYVAPVLLLGTALWLTGSRTAVAAVLLALALAGVLSVRTAERRRNLWLAIALSLVVAAAAAGWMWHPSQRNDPAAFSLRTRLELSRAGIRMMTTQPIFGIGVGQFYVLSNDYAGPMLATLWRPHENAHNYFVQVLAELGIPGLLLFLAVLGFALREGSTPGALRIPGLVLGLVTFLLTCVPGHPLVVPEAAYPFWLGLGLAATPVAARPMRLWTRLAAALMILFLVVSLPGRTRAAVRHANMENTTVGLTQWQRGPDGERFRWSGARATFYVTSAGRSIRIPMRHGPDGPLALEVHVFFDGQEADRVLFNAGEDWHTVRLARTVGRGSDADFSRIDLEVRQAGASGALDTAGSPKLLMIGQPIIVWGP